MKVLSNVPPLFLTARRRSSLHGMVIRVAVAHSLLRMIISFIMRILEQEKGLRRKPQPRYAAFLAKAVIDQSDDSYKELSDANAK